MFVFRDLTKNAEHQQTKRSHSSTKCSHSDKTLNAANLEMQDGAVEYEWNAVFDLAGKLPWTPAFSLIDPDPFFPVGKFPGCAEDQFAYSGNLAKIHWF